MTTATAPVTTYAEVERLVDRAACFNFHAAPGAEGHALRFLHVDLQPPAESGVRCVNRLGPAAGRLDLRLVPIPHDFRARPDLEPPRTPLDPGHSQRLALQQAVFRFGDGRDGFRGFGTGRTFPLLAGGRTHLAVGVVGEILEGEGRLRGLAGNFVLSGTLDGEGRFHGNILVRFVDPDGVLHAADLVPSGDEGAAAPDPGLTFLQMRAQKRDEEQRSTFSLEPDGSIRGINVPLDLHRMALAMSVEGGLQSALRVEETVGLEVGFTAVDPAVPAPQKGTSLDPMQFQGTSRYRFFDATGRTVGSFSANFLEGRTFEVRLAGAPGLPSLRFAYFGTILDGTGCFDGVAGMFYGVSGSVFEPPPSFHILFHFYGGWLLDPEGRYRASR